MRRAALPALAVAALVAIALAAFNLERGRAGLEISALSVGETPATVHRRAGGTGPLVVVAHGFAGSRQMMRSWSLTLARSGYVVVAFDFQGHGRNPVPMSGDVAAIDGTTRLLVEETRRVLAAGRALPGVEGAALLGHSMATDIIVRAAMEERAAGRPVAAVVALSMFSQAVTATEPRRLLAIAGEYEGGLRRVGLDALRQVAPGAEEGLTVTAGDVARRAVAAPGVEHVGILFSATALREARDWLDAAFGRAGDGPILARGPWILLLLAGIVALLRPLVELLPDRAAPAPTIPAGRFLAAILLPAILAPLVCVPLRLSFLPVLVADYLALHLLVYGGLQIVIARPWRQGWGGVSVAAVALSALWGIAAFGLAMDRYVASFAPNAERALIIACLVAGTAPFMVADSLVTGGGRGVWRRRIAARAALLGSLGAAAALDPERLMFLLIVLPVLLLFFLVHGQMGRWVGRRGGWLGAGLGLGLCLAWALGVTFPLFAAG